MSGDEASPIIVEALADSLSIIKGNVYQFREYLPQWYERHEERPPKSPEGTLEGIGGKQPCCVAYPKRFTKPIEFPEYLEWI